MSIISAAATRNIILEKNTPLGGGIVLLKTCLPAVIWRFLQPSCREVRGFLLLVLNSQRDNISGWGSMRLLPKSATQYSFLR